MDILIFEILVLKSFIDFQAVFDNAHLDIAKPKYNKRERFMWTKNLILVIAISSILIVIHIVMLFAPGFWLQVIEQMFLLFCFLNISLFYFWVNVRLYYSMYLRHKYEFNKWAARNIALFFLIQASIGVILVRILRHFGVIYCNHFIDIA